MMLDLARLHIMPTRHNQNNNHKSNHRQHQQPRENARANRVLWTAVGATNVRRGVRSGQACLLFDVRIVGVVGAGLVGWFWDVEPWCVGGHVVELGVYLRVRIHFGGLGVAPRRGKWWWFGLGWVGLRCLYVWGVARLVETDFAEGMGRKGTDIREHSRSTMKDVCGPRLLFLETLKKKSQKHKGKLLDLVAVLSYSKDHSCLVKEKIPERRDERSPIMKEERNARSSSPLLRNALAHTYLKESFITHNLSDSRRRSLHPSWPDENECMKR